MSYDHVVVLQHSSGSKVYSLLVVNIATGELCRKYNVPPVSQIFNIPNTKYLFCTNEYRSAFTLDLYTGAVNRSKGQYYISALDDGTLYSIERQSKPQPYKYTKTIWKINRLTILNNHAHFIPVFSLELPYHRNGDRFVGGSHYAFIQQHVIDLKCKKLIGKLKEYDMQNRPLVCGNQIVLGYKERTAKLPNLNFQRCNMQPITLFITPKFYARADSIIRVYTHESEIIGEFKPFYISNNDDYVANYPRGGHMLEIWRLKPFEKCLTLEGSGSNCFLKIKWCDKLMAEKMKSLREKQILCDIKIYSVYYMCSASMSILFTGLAIFSRCIFSCVF